MEAFITATYEVELDKQDEFMDVLKACELLMREEGFITARRTIWMQSKDDPKMIVEIFELVDETSFDSAQDNAQLMAYWTRLTELWIRGGFGVNEFPEAAKPWAMYRSLS